MPATYEPIASQTLGSSSSSVTFSSIPGTMTDLVLVVNSTDNVQGASKRLRFNSDSGSNYSRTFLYGDGSTAISGRDSSQTAINLPTASTIYTELFVIMSYANTNVNKTVLHDFSMSGYIVGRTVGLWRSTAAITSLELSSASVAFSSGSTFSLYGIKAA